jgi:emp24/gp25L/p24 family/GOLD
MDGTKERQGDFVFTANDVGEYMFCFNNEMSTFADKMVDFEIAVSQDEPCGRWRHKEKRKGWDGWLTCEDDDAQVENESRATLPSKQGTTPEQTSALEESIFKLSGQLSTISRNQKYFRTRENRNFSTVRSTESRIFNFSLIEGGIMVAMALLQVFVVRTFFQGARKGYV